MKLFKKVMAVVLVGAMAVSMLTACGSTTSKTTKVVNALKNAGIEANKDATMTEDTNKAMTSLQKATEGIANGTIDLTKSDDVTAVQNQLNTNLSDFSFTAQDSASKKYDLYIWTNNSSNRVYPQIKYAWLMQVQYKHVNNTDNLKELLNKDFVEKGQFKGTSSDMAMLKKLLSESTLNGKPVENVSVSSAKVYGMDVLLVSVPHGTIVPDTGATKVPAQNPQG